MFIFIKPIKAKPQTNYYVEFKVFKDLGNVFLLSAATSYGTVRNTKRTSYVVSVCV